jgi:hypothetical protein
MWLSLGAQVRRKCRRIIAEADVRADASIERDSSFHFCFTGLPIYEISVLIETPDRAG